jgi:hypothetical protein
MSEFPRRTRAWPNLAEAASSNLVQVRVRVPPPALDGDWCNWQHARLWTGRRSRLSRFESWVSSFAAAHGCGPAPVRRETRVGTGWRLPVLVAQWQEAPA